MVKQFALLGTVAFCLCAACSAVAQSKTGAANPTPRASLRAPSSHKQGQFAEAARSLPDAPSAQDTQKADSFNKVSEGSRLPLAASELAKPAGLGPGLPSEIHLPQAPSASAFFQAVPDRKQSPDFFSKYLSPSHARQNSPFQPAPSDKLVARATDAASRVFLVRDPSGKRHVNTSYFLRALTSVAAENASRRYRARSSTAPLTSFGSTVGNDAGMNLLHEFAPNIKQKVAGHLPDTLARIGQHFSHLNAR